MKRYSFQSPQHTFLKLGVKALADRIVILFQKEACFGPVPDGECCDGVDLNLI